MSSLEGPSSGSQQGFVPFTISRVHTYLIMNWVNGMRIWRAVRGEGSELGSSSRARGTPLAQGEGSELGIGPDPKAPPTPCWGVDGLEVWSWGGGGILED